MLLYIVDFLSAIHGVLYYFEPAEMNTSALAPILVRRAMDDVLIVPIIISVESSLFGFAAPHFPWQLFGCLPFKWPPNMAIVWQVVPRARLLHVQWRIRWVIDGTFQITLVNLTFICYRSCSFESTYCARLACMLPSVRCLRASVELYLSDWSKWTRFLDLLWVSM